MNYKIKNYFGEEIRVKPRLELYSVENLCGEEMPGLAIMLDDADCNEGIEEQYAVLTVSFGEFIGLKNAAYVDTNNCPFANQLLEQGVGVDTQLRKASGFCEYPLWEFSEDFLKEAGSENYKKYSDAYDNYMNSQEIEESDDFSMDEMV